MPSTEAPTFPDGDATELSILEAAARIFMAQGYEGASMERIALDAAVGRRTLYNRFESKKALFEATMGHLWRRMPIRDAADRLRVLDDPDQSLKALASVLADFWSSDHAAAFTRMVIAESIRFPELGDSFIERGRNPARLMVVHSIQHLVTRGFLVPHDADVSSAQFIALITGPTLWDRIVGPRRPLSKATLARIVDDTVRTFLARYRA
jgi:AcrR family transcriptional regulator